MKKLLILPLIIVAAGCGSQAGATSTVTAPPETVTNTVKVADDTQVAACQLVIRQMSKAGTLMLKGSTLYAAQILPAYKAGLYGGSLDKVTANIRAGTAHVKNGTAILHKAQGFMDQCVG